MDDTAKKHGSEKRQRRKLVAMRLSDSEFAEITRRADMMQLTVAAYVRMQCLDQEPPRSSRRPSVEAVEVSRVLAELGKIGSNVNQIARVLNANGMIASDEIEAALQTVADVRAACMAALGRKP